MDHEPLKKEDYQEPRCVLCDPQTGKPQVSNSIPMDRVVQKLDEYCDRKDFAGAERHLNIFRPSRAQPDITRPA